MSEPERAMLIQASFEAGRVENAIQLRGLPVLSMDPAENFGWGVPVVFSMPMSEVEVDSCNRRPNDHARRACLPTFWPF